MIGIEKGLMEDRRWTEEGGRRTEDVTNND
jgi:hypothetical protein